MKRKCFFTNLCDYDTAAAADGWRGLFYADSPWAVCHADKPSVGRRVALVMNTLFCIIGCFIFNGDVQFLMYSLLVGHLGCIAHPENGKASVDGLGGCGDGGGQLCGNVWGRAVF